MIVCRMKWTEFLAGRNGLTKRIAAFLAIHQRSEAPAVKICEGAGLLITSCNYRVSDSVFVAGGREEGKVVGGGCEGKGNAGSKKEKKKITKSSLDRF